MIVSIANFKVLRTGVDGGHSYIETEISHEGNNRRLTIFFKGKFEESKIILNQELTIKGDLHDDGLEYGLVLNSSEFVS